MDLFALRSAGKADADAWVGPPWPGPGAAVPTWTGDRAGLAAALTAAGEPGADAVAEPGLSLVIAGQQPALGGGPLYTLVKAAQALAIAQRLDAAGTRARALFWVASEDHDLGEAGHADLLLRDGRLVRVASPLGGGRASLRHRPVLRWWDALLETMTARLGRGLGRRWVEQHAPLADEGMGAWTCRWLRTLLPGLLCVEGHALRGLWVAAARQLTLGWPAAAMADAAARLGAAGAAAPLRALAQPPWFRDDADGRVALDPDQALRLLDEAPELLSPGAALRPVLQQAALPAIVAIGGPGEFAYHAQLGPVYAAAGTMRPWLVPRVGVTVAPSWWRRGCAHYAADPLAVAAGQPIAIPSDDRVQAGIHALGDQVLRLRSEADPATAAALSRALHDLERAQRTRSGRMRGVHPPPGALTAWARPRQRPQDRTLCLLQAVWEWGPGIAHAVASAIDAADPGQRVLIPV